MIFYNGFNLLLDVLIGLAVWFFTYRLAWWDGYKAGTKDSFNETCVTHALGNYCPECGPEAKYNNPL